MNIFKSESFFLEVLERVGVIAEIDPAKINEAVKLAVEKAMERLQEKASHKESEALEKRITDVVNKTIDERLRPPTSQEKQHPPSTTQPGSSSSASSSGKWIPAVKPFPERGDEPSALHCKVWMKRRTSVLEMVDQCLQGLPSRLVSLRVVLQTSV